MADLAELLAAFGQLLHAAGVPVTPERSSRFAGAVLLAEPTDLTELAALGRTTLLSGRDQIEIFDRVFDQVFRGLADVADYRGQSPGPPTPNTSPKGERTKSSTPGTQLSSSPTPAAALAGDSSDDPAGEDAPHALMSAQERLGEKHFADCTPDELEFLADLVERLPLVPPRRQARRQHRSPHGRNLDLRATLRKAHRTSGDPVRQVRRARTSKPRRIVLLADVSGSMEPYSRVYLHLLRGAVRALHAEAFVFATRLTRLTRPLGAGTPDQAYRRAAKAAPDWSGGTRVGDALKDFLDQHGRRGMARGAVVVIVSDGWDTGDPALVGTAMSQLSKLAHRVVWVNPRKAARDFQPRVGGMAAALPYIDVFVSGHSMNSLREVLAAIGSDE